jgi:hypothetical protein
MTKFNKEDFTWDGMYLMYAGTYEGQPTMDQVHPDCHPSWVGKPKPAFIARFKYGYKPYKAWINFLCKTTAVEDYLELSAESSPKQAMQYLGYKGK